MEIAKGEPKSFLKCPIFYAALKLLNGQNLTFRLFALTDAPRFKG